MPLKLVKRLGSETWYIRGTVRGHRIFETTGTANRKQAETARALRETELFEEAVFGSRPIVSFKRAALSYLDFEPRSERTKDYVGRFIAEENRWIGLIGHFGDTPISKIGQDAADNAVKVLLKPNAAPSTKTRIVYTPISCVLNFAADRSWCERVRFSKPTPAKGKTRWLTPAEATALVNAASPHLRPLLHFYLCTGARVSEALSLDWADVDIREGWLRFRDTKSGIDRIARLPEAAVVTLANLPGEEVEPGVFLKRGKVFRRDDGHPYEDREGYEGGQIKTAFRTACRRAGLVRPVLGIEGAPKLDKKGRPKLKPTLTPHDLRHTWASWFYALTKDLLLLKDEGGWATLSMVERYAHLMPSALADEISAIWGAAHPRVGALPGGAPVPEVARSGAKSVQS